jgi:hypothetical protein
MAAWRRRDVPNPLVCLPAAPASPCVGRFPPLDRIDYIDHAVVLAEAPFASWTDQARRFATSETLEPKVTSGRFCYSWMTGRMGSNDDAVAFLRKLAQLGST